MMLIPRNYYNKEDLEYMVNQDVEVMVQNFDQDFWVLRKFHVHGIIHDEWLYGKTEDHRTSNRPYFILYTHVVAAPLYDKLKTTKLFKLVK